MKRRPSEEWPLVRLGDVVEQVYRLEALKPTKEYRLLGVKWYAHGVFERERKFGSLIAAKQLNRVEEGDLISGLLTCPDCSVESA